MNWAGRGVTLPTGGQQPGAGDGADGAERLPTSPDPRLPWGFPPPGQEVPAGPWVGAGARGLGFWGNEYSSGRAGLCFCLLSREGLGFRFTLTPAGTVSRYPAPAPVSLAPAAQLLLPSSPGPAVPGAAPWRLPRLPQAPPGAAPALSPFSREGLTSSCGSQDHRSPLRSGSTMTEVGWWKLTFLRKKKSAPKVLYEIPDTYAQAEGSAEPPGPEGGDPNSDFNTRLEKIVDKNTKGKHVKVSNSGRFKEKKKVRATLAENPNLFDDREGKGQ